MGMYTELCLALELRDDAPSAVVALLKSMADGEGQVPEGADFSGHDLFKTDRWACMLRNGGSAYFAGATHCDFSKGEYKWDRWKLTMRTSIKNYTHEWEKFLDFLAPFVDERVVGDRTFVGHMRYEEWADPVLIYVKDGRALFVEPTVGEVWTNGMGDSQRFDFSDGERDD